MRTREIAAELAHPVHQGHRRAAGGPDGREVGVIEVVSDREDLSL